jgi:hypothetical protein
MHEVHSQRTSVVTPDYICNAIHTKQQVIVPTKSHWFQSHQFINTGMYHCRMEQHSRHKPHRRCFICLRNIKLHLFLNIRTCTNTIEPLCVLCLKFGETWVLTYQLLTTLFHSCH